MPTIEYQGEHFRLARSFDDYDQYKEAADNIHPDEIDRIEAKILSIQIAGEFRTKHDFVLTTLRVTFPGFGTEMRLSGIYPQGGCPGRLPWAVLSGPFGSPKTEMRPAQ